MNTVDMPLRDDVQLKEEDVATLASAFKALAFHAALACDRDEEPEGLQDSVNAGLEVVDKLFA